MSPDEFVERLKSLVTDHLVGSNQLLTRFSNFVQEASKATGNNPTGERMDAQTMLSRWLDFNLASYSAMTAGSLSLLNGLLAAAENTLIPKPAQAPAAVEPSQAARVELQLSGRPGERATAGFALENHFDLPLTVTFESDDLVSESGSSLPASYVCFEPATLLIPSRGQAVVQAAVLITPEFMVGQTYTTTIRLLGSEAKRIQLSITILPKDAGQPVGSAPESSKSAKKRRTRA